MSISIYFSILSLMRSSVAFYANEQYFLCAGNFDARISLYSFAIRIDGVRYPSSFKCSKLVDALVEFGDMSRGEVRLCACA